MGRRAGRLEHEHGVDHAADRQVARDDTFGPGVQRQVHDPGALQRLRHLRHLEPGEAALAQQYVCPASQNDVSVYKNLLFMSSESTGSRTDCGFGGVPDPISKDRVRGIRVFDISDIKTPKLVTSVQTCRGSHTHTVVTQQGDTDNVYIYVSGSAGVRSADELPGCQDGGIDDPNTARFRLEVIKVPLKAPEKAAIVSSPRVFSAPAGAAAQCRASAARPAAPTLRRAARGSRRRAGCAAPRVRPQPRAQPRAPGAAAAAGRAGGGRGRTQRTADRPEPVSRHHGVSGDRPRRRRVRRARPAARHPRRRESEAHRLRRRSEHVVLALGDLQQRRQEGALHRRVGRRSRAALPVTDKPEWGANALFTIEDNKMKFQSYYKLPAAADGAGELRRAQRVAHSDPRP